MAEETHDETHKKIGELEGRLYVLEELIWQVVSPQVPSTPTKEIPPEITRLLGQIRRRVKQLLAPDSPVATGSHRFDGPPESVFRGAEAACDFVLATFSHPRE